MRIRAVSQLSLTHSNNKQRKYSLYPLSDENLNLIRCIHIYCAKTTKILLNKC